MQRSGPISFQSLSASLFVPAILILSCLLIRIVDPPPLPALRLIAFDTWQWATPRIADPSFPAKVVAIDEQSLKQFGQWPWNRSIVADLVDRIHAAGAKSIALDLVFAEADRFPAGRNGSRHSGDERLAAAVAASRAVLAIVGDARGSISVPPPKAALAAAGADPRSSVHRFPAAVLPLAPLADAAPGLGAVNWFPERDQIVRRVPLLVAIADRVFPSLALEALRVGNNQSTILVQSSSDADRIPPRPSIQAVRVDKYSLPVDPNGELWMRFAAPDPRRTISAADVLEGRVNPAQLSGRYVFIGATAIGLSDVRATPLAADVPGVEIHAQALEQIIAGDSITRPDYMLGVELTLLVALGIAVALLLNRFGAAPAALVTGALVGGITIVSWLSYNHLGVLIDPTYPTLSTALIYSGCSLTSYLETERERNQIRTAFGHYLDPAMVEQLAREPSKLKLGGEMRDITILFVDVRSFTRRSERMSASQLVQFINRLFTPLTEAVLSNKGTIDKYMGDGILAFWNAPMSDPRHPEHACRAALAMLDALARFNRDDPSVADEPVRIGIGINTGDAVVGNVGSPRRFDYSVLGEVVNTASRLEEATKSCGADIVIGESCALAVSHFAILEVGQVTLRGKAKPERIFALIGDETTKSSALFQTLAQRHVALLAAVENGDPPARDWALNACIECAVPGTESIYRSLRSRLAAP